MESVKKQPKRDMRECLETWRQDKGRTPMKRLSYMHDYATPDGTVIRVHPVVHSPRLLLSLKHSLTATKKRTFAAPVPGSLTAKKPALTPYAGPQKKLKIQRENQENVQLSVKKLPKAIPAPKQPRREQLEKWLALHGSTMKGRGVDNSSRTVGGMTVRTAMTDVRPRAPPRRAELSRVKVSQHGLPQSSRKSDSCSDKEARLRALRDQFQRDIDDTIAEMCSEKVEPPPGDEDSGMELARQLDFDDECPPPLDSEEPEGSQSRPQDDDSTATNQNTATSDDPCPAPSSLSHKRRRSHVHFDPSLTFKSTTIKYSMALSEPRRRRRRHTFVAATPDSKETWDIKLLHLTPVRRSTRKNRCGPGLELDHSMCFDSPSEASSVEGYGRVEVVPNRALAAGKARLNTDGADD